MRSPERIPAGEEFIVCSHVLTMLKEQADEHFPVALCPLRRGASIKGHPVGRALLCRPCSRELADPDTRDELDNFTLVSVDYPIDMAEAAQA